MIQRNAIQDCSLLSKIEGMQDFPAGVSAAIHLKACYDAARHLLGEGFQESTQDLRMEMRRTMDRTGCGPVLICVATLMDFRVQGLLTPTREMMICATAHSLALDHRKSKFTSHKSQGSPAEASVLRQPPGEN